MEPLSSYSHRESAEFHLIMNVCGENPIMALLHQAYRKHTGGEAKAFMGHISQLEKGYCANQILLCESVSTCVCVCVCVCVCTGFTCYQQTHSHCNVLISVLFWGGAKQVAKLTRLHIQNNWTERVG